MNYNQVSLLLVGFPVLSNWVLAIFAFFISFEDFASSPSLCYATVILACFALLTSILGFIIHDLGPGRALFAAVAQGGALLFVFAGVYRGFGLLYSGQPRPTGAINALYFSIITWTTVGYGDFTPPEALQLVAALQAMLGYFIFGSAVGLGTYLLIERRP